MKDSESLNFGSLKYNPSNNKEAILLEEVCDPDSNFYNANVKVGFTLQLLRRVF